MFTILRSKTDKQVRMLSRKWRVHRMLSNVSERGPWEVVGSGDEKRLKLHYRRALDRDGYCVVDDKCSLFDRRLH
jgi:hypothetical protein